MQSSVAQHTYLLLNYYEYNTKNYTSMAIVCLSVVNVLLYIQFLYREYILYTVADSFIKDV